MPKTQYLRNAQVSIPKNAALGLGHSFFLPHTAAVKLGIISDTHGRVPNGVHQALAGVDHILHAGDVGPVDVLTELEAIAPVSAVLGNTDHGIILPETRVEEFAGHKFLIHHIVDMPVPSQRMRATLAEEQPDVVVFGHTHIPFHEKIDGILYLNPGSACQPREDSAASVAIVECTPSRLAVRFVALT
jgi:putative phosphoesterase